MSTIPNSQSVTHVVVAKTHPSCSCELRPPRRPHDNQIRDAHCAQVPSAFCCAGRPCAGATGWEHSELVESRVGVPRVGRRPGSISPFSFGPCRGAFRSHPRVSWSIRTVCSLAESTVETKPWASALFKSALILTPPHPPHLPSQKTRGSYFHRHRHGDAISW